MILAIHQLVHSRMADAVKRLYDVTSADPIIAEMTLEAPPRRALGDIAVPIAFALARRLKKAPRVIAQDLAAALGTIEGIERIEAASNGYLNFFLDRPLWLRRWTASQPAAAGPHANGKAIVEHTAINPNKAAHIGHLRNAALGDALGRLLRFQGRQVEIQNYIDDTGVQVADVVVGFRELEHRGLAEVRALEATTRFDYYCWDLYAKVTEWYEQDKSRLTLRTDALHAIERGGNETASTASFIAERIVRAHLATMRRMNIAYDLLTWEGDILRLHFWAHAFEFLKKTGAVFLQSQGKLAGCWVMRIEEDEPAADAAVEGQAPDGDEPEQREKVIVRSDGTVTYVGKDMAYQLWKFGLLDLDFHYRPFHPSNGVPDLWSTTSDPTGNGTAVPAFGHAQMVCNVIDIRQSYLQKLVKQALAVLGFEEQARRSIHYSYAMVALSHATAREFGYETTDEAGKPFVEVSGRKGLGVKADDLLDRLTEKAASEVARRNPEFGPDDVRRTAETIATAAVRYFMVKFSRGKVIAFDIDEALSFEGESGPYLQYATVRANNIFAKLKEREGLDASGIQQGIQGSSANALTDGSDESHELWGLAFEAARLDEVVEQAVRTLELSVLAKHAFHLGQQFNGFYHRFPILNEDNKEARLWRAAAVGFYRDQMTKALELIGAAVPDRM